MLTLTVKENKKVYIGDDIVVSVHHARGGKGIRVSIDAPQEVKILREELKELPQ